MKTQFTTVLFLFFFLAASAPVHTQQLLTIMNSPTATAANYDDIMTRLQAKGLDRYGWTFHAIGAAQPAGLFSIGLFPSQAALTDRLEKVRPVFQEAGATPPAPQVYEVYNTFTGNLPAATPAAGIVVFFDTKMTPTQYDQTVEGIKKAGVSLPPPGQLFHVAFKTPNGINVIDVWESMEQFQAFGNSLMPVLQAAGVTPAPPAIYGLHNFIAVK